MNRRHLAALLLVPALALTGCGGDAAPDPTPSAQPPTDTPATAPSGAGGGSTGRPGTTPSVPSAIPSKVVNDFVTCMRKHGIDVPDDPQNWKPDGADGKTQKALMACIGRSGAPAGP